MKFAGGHLAIVAAILAVGMLAMPVRASAQPDRKNFDPAHPFAHITSAEQWVKKFISGKPNLVANDPYGNMTSREFQQKSWLGQNIGHPDQTPAKIKGSGGEGVIIRSPYPYKSAKEQYDAWLKAARSDAKMNRATLPNWSGDWRGGVANGVLGGNARVSAVMAALTAPYKPRFEDLLRAEWAGHAWWSNEFCLPNGFGRLYDIGATWHLLMDVHMVMINKDWPINMTRYIYTDGRGFLPEAKQSPQWYGDSIGFWDGDELVVYTKDIKQWVMTHGMPEYSGELKAVERMKRLGDKFLVDVTLYDPKAFAFPWHDVAVFDLLKDWTVAPARYSQCVDTNNIYLNARGELGEHVPGDLEYHDPTDHRPWATAFKRWDDAHPKEAARWKAALARDTAAASAAKK